MARPIQDSIVLFGDSITSKQEVPGSLQAKFCEAYRRTMDVLNRGYGGYTTRTAMPIIDQFLCHKDETKNRSQIKLMTIWLGANDAALPTAPSRQHVPLKEYTENLHKMLNDFTSGEKYVVVPNIIIITAPPLYQANRAEESKSVHDPKVTHEYVKAARTVGEEWKAKGGKEWAVSVVDAEAAIIDMAGGTGIELDEYLPDGLHLGTLGYEAVWQGIRKILRTDFKGRGVDVDEVYQPVPDMSDIDPQDASTVVAKFKGDYIRH